MSRYTSANQYANMLEKRALALEEVADGLAAVDAGMADKVNELACGVMDASREVRRRDRARKAGTTEEPIT